MTVGDANDEPRQPTTPEEASRPAANQSGIAGSQAEPVAGAPSAVDGTIPRTRVGTTYVALVCSLLVLVVLLVFILENTRRVPVTFFGATGNLPLGVALLLAAVAGAVILGVAGTVRIVQLRRRVRQIRR